MDDVVPSWYHRGMAMNFRPPDALAEQLREQADSERISVQLLLVKAAEEYLTRHAKKAVIARSVAGTKVEFAEALRRLGEGA